MRADPFAILDDARLAEILRRHHTRANRQLPRLWWHLLPQLPALALGRPVAFTERTRAVEADLYLAIQPEQGAFCHQTALGLRARTIVEFGTSYGVSTIWLAAALRRLGGGTVIGTEILPEKAEIARQNLAEVGLSEFAEIRVGDALQTLRELPEVDLFLNDGSPVHALEVLQLVAPRLRPGAVVITDNTGTMPANYRDYLRWVRDPRNGFASGNIPFKLGTELSVRIPSEAR